MGYEPDDKGRIGHLAERENVEDIIYRVHQRKVEMADVVVALDIDDYIGTSTKSLIHYAQGLGKPVHYFSKMTDRSVFINEDAKGGFYPW